jgi:hypothetical protein
MLTLFPRGSLFDTPFAPIDYIPRPLISNRRSFLTDPTDAFWNNFADFKESRLRERSPDFPIVEQTDDGYTCHIPTPGVKRSQIQLSLQGDRTVELTVKSEPEAATASSVTSAGTEEAGASTVAINDDTAKGASSFWMTAVTLPRDADMSLVTSSYSDGMLTVSAPRRKTIPEEEDSEEVKALSTEVKAKRARLEELAKQLQEERARFEEVATELRGARREEWHKRASLRRTLAIADDR